MVNVTNRLMYVRDLSAEIKPWNAAVYSAQRPRRDYVRPTKPNRAALSNYSPAARSAATLAPLRQKQALRQETLRYVLLVEYVVYDFSCV